MKIYRDIDTLATSRATAVTVGSFDGVHAGHGVLLSRLRDMARAIDAESVVVTFEPHPRIAMGRAAGMGLLTTVEERAYLLAQHGVDNLVVVHFDEAFRQQSYEEFVRNTLVARLGMRGMVVGYNHRLGRDSAGGYDALRPLGEECGFRVERVEQYLDTGDKVSSTVIRNLIATGDMSRAREMLGHPYIIIGKAHDGRVAAIEQHKLLPAAGRYRAMVNDEERSVEVAGRELLLDGSVSGDVVIAF